jgi:hypothetical protein
VRQPDGMERREEEKREEGKGSAGPAWRGDRLSSAL